jgi:transketolase
LRSAYGLILLEKLEEFDFFVASCDTSTSAGLEKLKRNRRGQYLEFGISEQAAVTISAALASQGSKVFLSTFAPFIAYRAAEMIKLSISYDNSPVCLVGIAAGLVQSHLGGTHCSLEEQSLFASFGNIEICSPADFLELESSLDSYLNNPRPIYLRLTGDNKLYHGEKIEKCPGLSQIIQGEEVALVFSGALLSQAPTINEHFKAKGKQFSFYSLYMVNAKNFSVISEILSSYKYVFFVEEHTMIGSHLSRIKEQLNELNAFYIGPINSYSGLGSSYQEALKEFGLGSNEISKRVENYIIKLS